VQHPAYPEARGTSAGWIQRPSPGGGWLSLHCAARAHETPPRSALVGFGGRYPISAPTALAQIRSSQKPAPGLNQPLAPSSVRPQISNYQPLDLALGGTTRPGTAKDAHCGLELHLLLGYSGIALGIAGLAACLSVGCRPEVRKSTPVWLAAPLPVPRALTEVPSSAIYCLAATTCG
jgi:hypothetical protein